MGLLLQLTEILFHGCPFDEKVDYWLNPAQCHALCIYFSSNLERLLGAILRPISLDSSASVSRGRWKFFSAFYDKSFFKLWSNRKENKSSSAILGDGCNTLAILEELRSLPNAIDELYRVVNEAESYLYLCSNEEWWKPAFAMGANTEVLEVHIHDLMWCIAGLKLALQTVRGVELESRAQFTRLSIAECYAEMGALSSQGSQLVSYEEQDRDHLLALLQQMKHKYDEMNRFRKIVMSTPEKLKHEAAHLLLQKLGVSSDVAKLDSTSFSTWKLPESMQISSQDLSFSARPQLITRGSHTSVYEASWQGLKVAAKQFDFHTCKEYFTYEAAVFIGLQSPFIIRLFGWSVDTRDYSSYLIFELVKKNLATLIKEKNELRKPLSLPVVIDLMLQLARAMDYLHQKRIMHKDLRPSNVLIQPINSSPEFMEKGYGRVKLCNFGFSRLGFQASNLSALAYRAPEVWIDQQDFSYEADVYSFGMTFAYCLTGSEFFSGISSEAGAREVVSKGIGPELPLDCPRMLMELLQKCWSTDWSLRPSFPSITMTLRHLKLLMMRTRLTDELHDQVVDKEFSLSTPVISFAELGKAMNDFTDKMLSVKAHSMYRGILADGTKVLVQHMGEIIDVRKLWIQTSQLLSLRHSNVTGLRGVCIHGSQYWLVFEDNAVLGSLDEWLVEDKNDQQRLDVATCYSIVVGAACGLQYLHAQGHVYVVTTENILVDEKYEGQLLIHSVLLGEERATDLEKDQSLDVLHMGIFIRRILSYLSRDTVCLDSRMESQVSMLAKVESLGSSVNMDEVVELLESVYEPTCEEDLPFKGRSFFEDSVFLDTDVDSTMILTDTDAYSMRMLGSSHRPCDSLIDFSQDFVDHSVSRDLVDTIDLRFFSR